LYLNKIFLNRCAPSYIEEKAKRAFNYLKRDKCLNAFLKVNMTNPIQLATVAQFCRVNYINPVKYINVHSHRKSLDNKATHIVPL
jgi:hypothetical protein